MGDYFDLVADRCGLPRPPRITRAAALAELPENLLSFMLESRRFSNAWIKRESGVKLLYPTVADGWSKLIETAEFAFQSPFAASGGVRSTDIYVWRIHDTVDDRIFHPSRSALRLAARPQQ